MSKLEVSAEDTALYTLYVSRVTHEGNLFWVRYSAFFVFVSGSFFGLYQILPNENSYVIPVFPYMYMIHISGTLSSLIWLIVTIDGLRWQAFFTKKVQDLESKLEIDFPLYGENLISRFFPDVVVCAGALPLFAFLGWITISFNTDAISAAVCSASSIALCLIIVPLQRFAMLR